MSISTHIHPGLAKSLQRAVLDWYAAHSRDLPWRHTSDPYAIAVSEIMLQQTQVDRVEPKYREFLAAFPSWKALAEASVGQVLRLWAPLGYNGRAVRLRRLAQWVIVNGGELPTDEGALKRLPGVGPYTAAAIVSFAFGQKTAVIDTNIRRVIGRALMGDPYPRPESDRLLRPIAVQLVPDAGPCEWHQALMDLGGSVCTSRQPQCTACPIAKLCLARAALAEAAPPRGRGNGERFEGSRRYYRGRILEALRALPEGEALPLGELGERVKPDYGPEQGPWLRDLTERMVADGLVRYDVESENVSLP